MKKLLITIIAFILAMIAIFVLGFLIFLFDEVGLLKPFIIAGIIVLGFILAALMF